MAKSKVKTGKTKTAKDINAASITSIDVPLVPSHSQDVTATTLYETDPEQDLVASESIPSGELITNPEIQVKKALHYRLRPHPNIEGVGTLSTEKRITKLRDKIGVAADHLADELMFAVSSRTKKDKEYIKGLVWSLGVLFDKLNTGNSDTVSVKLPTKLLDNIKVVIAIQAEKKASLRSHSHDVTASPSIPQAENTIDVSPTQVSST